MGFFKRLFGFDDRPAPPSFVIDYTKPHPSDEYILTEGVDGSDRLKPARKRPIRPIGELTAEPVKRGRGRPRKTESVDGGVLVKRGRGRPRKTEAGGTQVIAPVARAAAKKPKAKKPTNLAPKSRKKSAV